jgi:RNA polymerase-binding protein DksA
MELSQDELNQVRKALLEAKAALEKRVDTIHANARDPLDADSSEQAAQLGNVAVVSALESEAVHEIAEIEAALQRLAAGNYGICATCGEPINTERLQARPASAECLDCAETSF